jgi:hypothetical protein
MFVWIKQKLRTLRSWLKNEATDEEIEAFLAQMRAEQEAYEREEAEFKRR